MGIRPDDAAGRLEHAAREADVARRILDGDIGGDWRGYIELAKVDALIVIAQRLPERAARHEELS